jgi:hypothetical protein
VVGIGSYSGDTSAATNDGSASCGDSATSADVWYRFTPTGDCLLFLDTCGGATWDTVLSVHTGCPGAPGNELACNDVACLVQSRIGVSVSNGSTYWIHVAGWQGATGAFTLDLNCPTGGVWHFDTPDRGDDRWDAPEEPGEPESPNASIGPAIDNRIKPDFTHIFDEVYTTRAGGGYEADFGGTSAGTPITCGHFGLFFEMWADGIFGNTLPFPTCNPAVENCVFKNRPHMTTAKAIMINTASPYTIGPPADFTRTNQGWGLVQVGRLYLLRSRFPVIINETQVLTLTSASVNYVVSVPANAYALRATLAYADPFGPISLARHAVNDLTLKVTAPNGTTMYWGNCGLREGNWSSSACTTGDHPFLNNPGAQVIDTVENVFVQIPVAGTWTVQVIAEEIVADAHPESPGVNDADFALVVSIDMNCNGVFGNFTSDADDILERVSCDCNNDAVPDECQGNPLGCTPPPGPG